MPPLLGLSIQLANSKSLFRPMQATKSTRHLAHELHTPYARVLDVDTRIGSAGAPLLCRIGNFTNSSEEK